MAPADAAREWSTQIHFAKMQMSRDNVRWLSLSASRKPELRKCAKRESQLASEMTAAGPDSTKEHEEALARIRAQIDEGFDQAERGELLDGDEVFREIRRRRHLGISHPVASSLLLMKSLATLFWKTR